MTQSMTAFSRLQLQSEWGQAIWEIRSVNHRYLELGFRLPENFRSLESKCRELARHGLDRGKVDCILRFEENKSHQASLSLNESLAQQLITTAQKLSSLTESPGSIDCLEIMRWPGVVEFPEFNFDELSKLILEGFEKALADLVDARSREGVELAKVLDKRLDLMDGQIQNCEKLMPEIIKLQKERILARFDEVKLQLEPERLEIEMVILAQKVDVAEEMDRLRTHIKEFKRILQKKGPAGRRLDFLIQEMNREANTMGSKSISAEMAHIVVDLKVLIEQMREQVQNIE